MSVERNLSQKIIQISAILMGLLFFWYLPWQAWLAPYRWLRVSLGTLLFILPGALVQHLVVKTPLPWHRRLPTGFVLSITVVGFLGILARLFQFSFPFLYNGLFIVSVLAMIPTVYRARVGIKFGFEVNRDFLWKIGQWIPVVVAIYIAARLAVPPPIHDDHLSYNALVAYYTHADKLDFAGVVKHISTVRFWLAFWPLAEAYLTRLSGLHPLLLTGIYLSPALAVLSMITLYDLGRLVGLKHNYALVAVTAQVASLVRLTANSQPGLAFFDLMTQDKVVAAFLLAPVVIGQSILFLESPDRRNLILTALVFIGLGFAHPTVLGLSAIVVMIYALLTGPTSKAWKPVVHIAFLMTVLMVPHFTLRFLEDEDRRIYTIDENIPSDRDFDINPNRLRVLENPRFYGISPTAITGFPYDLLGLAAVLSLTQLKRSCASRYILSVLILFGLALFPYTAWLLGLAITPFHLWRIPRLIPFGIAFGYLVQTSTQWILNHIKISEFWKSRVGKLIPLTAMVILLAGSLYILPWAKGNFSGLKPAFDRWYEQYIEIGEVLNQLEPDGDIIIGGPDSVTNDILPSLSIKTRLVSFRNENPGPGTTIWKSMVGEDEIPLRERLAKFEQYEVRYILLREEVTWMAEMLLKYPKHFKTLAENKKLVLYEFLP